MTTTWASRLEESEGKDLRLYATIEGVPYVFQEDDVDVPSSFEDSARVRLRNIVTFDQGETRLNLRARRHEGGGLRIEVQEDDAGTLAALFTPRRYRRGYLTDNVSATDTTIATSSTAWTSTLTPIADTIYVDGESIVFGATSGGTDFTGCTRAAWDSEAQKHYGGAENGAAVFYSPPTWIGRRVKLWGYFVNRDGSTTLNLREQLGTFRIEVPPASEGDDRWAIECSELSDEFSERKIGTALRDVTPERAGIERTGDVLTLQVGEGDNYNQFALPAGFALLTHALLRMDPLDALVPVIAQSSPDSIDLGITSLATPSPGLVAEVPDGVEPIDAPGADAIVESVRHVAYLNGEMGVNINYVLASRDGDNANGGFDELPGFTRTAFGENAWRFGAGIRAAEIDDAAFSALSRGVPWSLFIDDEIELQEVLFDFCLLTGSYWHVTRDGRLTVSTMAPERGASVMTVDDDLIIPQRAPVVAYDEESIAPRLTLRCNYDPLSRAFLSEVRLYDAELGARYPNRDDIQTITSRMIVLQGGRFGQDQTIARPQISQPVVQNLMRQQQVSGGRGRVIIKCVCALPVLAADVGDLVTLDIAALDLEGATSITDRLARVVAMRPRYGDGEVDAEFQLLDPLFHVTPAALVASAAGTTLTLNTTALENSSEQTAKPGRMFADGWDLDIIDVSTGTIDVRTLQSHTDTTLVIDSPLSFGVAANADYVTVNNWVGAANDNGLSASEFIFQMPDDEVAHELAGKTVTRWR